MAAELPGPASSALTEAAKLAFVSGMHVTVVVAAGVLVLAAVLAAALVRVNRP